MTDPINPGTTPESTPPAAAWPPPADPALPPIESTEPGAAAPAQAVQRDSGYAVAGRTRRSTGLRWAVALVGVAIVLVATAAVFALTAGRSQDLGRRRLHARQRRPVRRVPPRPAGRPAPEARRVPVGVPGLQGPVDDRREARRDVRQDRRRRVEQRADLHRRHQAVVRRDQSPIGQLGLPATGDTGSTRRLGRSRAPSRSSSSPSPTRRRPPTGWRASTRRS